MTDRTAELYRWFDELETSGKHAEHEISRGARCILAALNAAPDSEYRRMALCKLTDAVVVAAIAGRQPRNDANCGERPSS